MHVLRDTADINFTQEEQEGAKLAELEDTIRQRFADANKTMPDGHIAVGVLRSLSPTGAVQEVAAAQASDQSPRVFVS